MNGWTMMYQYFSPKCYFAESHDIITNETEAKLSLGVYSRRKAIAKCIVLVHDFHCTNNWTTSRKLFNF